MRLNQLHDLVAIVEAGGIRAAARGRGVSHPAIAKSIRQLEAELGVRLLQRGTRGIECTPAGAAFIVRARAVEAELRKAEEELAQFSGPGASSVRAGMSPSFVTVAPEAISRFLRAYPDAQLRITEGPASVLVPLVRDGTLDFAVVQRTPAATGPGLKFRVLYRGRMAIVCRRGHPLRDAKSLRDLAEAHWLGTNAPGTGSWVEQAFAAASLAFPKRFIQCESHAIAYEVMARSDSVMPIPLVAAPLKRDQLTEINLSEALPAIVLGLCTRADTRMTPAAASLAREVTEIIRQLARGS